MRLAELLKSTKVLGAINDKDICIEGIAYHSKKVQESFLFVCIRGYKVDGHKYLPQSVAQGAVAAIVEEFNEELDIPQYRVENSRAALAELGAAFYSNPSRRMKMIGVTATNGKTTTTYMINSMLENHGLKTGLIGTVTIKIDDSSIPSELTTPESLDLQYYLSKMTERGVTHTTMEVSSSALELQRVRGVEYDIVTFNNISRDHIDNHGSFEKYFAAKSSLITGAGENSYAVLNLDDKYSAALIDQTKARAITFGVNSAEGHLHCKSLDLSTGRGRFTVEILKAFTVGDRTYKPCEFTIELSVPGLHSVYNSMAAITVALLCGVEIETIQQTLKSFAGVERRFEFIFEDDIKIIDDHFANPGNINVTLQTLEYMDFKKLHLVYAIRGERGTTVNRENSEVIVNWADKLGIKEIIATKSISHVTAKDRVTAEELQVFLEVMGKAEIKVHLYDELTDAIAHSLAIAQAGDLILLAGCQGMDYGAEIALRQLHQKMLEYPKEKLFFPLKNRVAGITEEMMADLSS